MSFLKDKQIQEEYLQNFKISDIQDRRNLFDQTFCRVYQITLTDSRMFLMKELLLSSHLNKEEEIRKEISIHNKLSKTVDRPRILLKYHGYIVLIDKKTQTKSFCLFFDYKSNSLSNLIIRKNKMKSRFTLRELICVYRTLLNGLTYLQVRGLKFKDLVSNNIICDPDDDLLVFGNIFLSDIVSSQRSIESEKSKFGKGFPSEGRILIGNGPSENNFKDDVFCFGIILLELACFKVPDSLTEEYEGDEQQILKEINELFNEMDRYYYTKIKPAEKEIYEKFKEYLKSMLDLDVEKRVDFVELFKMSLLMTEEDIINHIMMEEKKYLIEDLVDKKNNESNNYKFVFNSLNCGDINQSTIEEKKVLNEIQNSHGTRALSIDTKREEGFDNLITKVYDYLRFMNFPSHVKYINIVCTATKLLKKNIENKLISHIFEHQFKGMGVRDGEIRCCHESTFHNEKGINNDELKYLLNVFDLNLGKYEFLEEFCVFLESGEYIDDIALQLILSKLMKLKKTKLKSLVFGIRGSKFNQETLRKLIKELIGKFCYENQFLETINIMINPKNDFSYDENLDLVSELIEQSVNPKHLNIFLSMISYRASFQRLIKCLISPKIAQLISLSICFSSGWLFGGGAPINDKNIVPLMQAIKNGVSKLLKNFSFAIICDGILDESLSSGLGLIEKMNLNNFNFILKGITKSEVDGEYWSTKYKNIILLKNGLCEIGVLDIQLTKKE